MKYITSFLIVLSFFTGSYAQVKKNVDIIRISTPITIDGILDEDVYKQVKPAADFVQIQPYNGKPSMKPT